MSTKQQRKGQKTPRREEQWAAARRAAARRRRIMSLAGGVVAVIVIAVLAVAVVGRLNKGGGTPIAAGNVSADPPHAGPLQAGEQVPDFSAPGLDGTRISWDDYRGAPTVLAVWASWCPHCQKELPVLARVADEYPGVQLVSVTSSIGLEPGPSPEEYMRDNDLTFPVAVDDSDNTIAAALGIDGYPTIYFVNADGTVAGMMGGEPSEDELRQAYETLHAQAA